MAQLHHGMAPPGPSGGRAAIPKPESTDGH